MFRKASIIVPGLVAVLTLGSCASDPSSAEIIGAMTEAMGAVDSYQYEAHFDIVVTGETDVEPTAGTVAMDMSGSVDLEGMEMQTDLTMEVSMPEEDTDIGEIGMGIYLVDEVMYMNAQLPDIGGLSMWLKSEVPERYWEDTNQIELQVELLEAAQVTVTGSEMVGSVDCWVLELTPDIAQLWETMIAQGQVAGEAWPEIPVEDELPEVSSFSAGQWVAKDTYYLIKAEMKITMVAPTKMAYSGTDGDVELEVTVTMAMHDHNAPVSIELPLEAEGAVDLSTFGGFLDGEE